MINKGLSKVAAFFLYLISLLPLSVLYVLGDFISFMLYHVLKYRRTVVMENLRNSFPDKSISELHEIEKEFYAYFGELMVETIKMLSISPQQIAKRYTFTNTQLVEKYESEQKSFLLAVGHYCNWEWSAIVIPSAIKAQALVIYKPLNNLVFDEVFKKAREKNGTKMIRMKIALREMVRFKNQMTCTVFATDQTPAHGDTQDWFHFLNQPTTVFMGLEKIAKATKSPVLFADMSRVKRGYYQCDFKMVCDYPSETADFEITKKHLSILENRINEEPAYWLWSHRRWKYKPKDHESA